MDETCTRCGLPQKLCVCEELTTTGQAVTLRIDERRYGRQMTVIDGFDATTDLDTLASELKSTLACGGTVTDRTIELQGDHRDRIDSALHEFGFHTGSLTGETEL
jgi:translation initiation factor 1